jgi:hypothetical protein
LPNQFAFYSPKQYSTKNSFFVPMLAAAPSVIELPPSVTETQLLGATEFFGGQIQRFENFVGQTEVGGPK